MLRRKPPGVGYHAGNVTPHEPPGQDGTQYLEQAKADVAWVIEEAVRDSGGTHRALVEELARLGFRGSSAGGTLGPTTVSNWTANPPKHPPTAWQLLALVRRFRISIDEHLWGPGLRHDVARLQREVTELSGIVRRHLDLKAEDQAAVERIGRAAPSD